MLALGGQQIESFQTRTTRSSGFLKALTTHCQVAGTYVPGLTKWQRATAIARYIHPRRDAWRQRAGLNPRVFRQLSEDAERGLKRWDGRYDVIVLLQTLFYPGEAYEGSEGRPYVVYTDNIHSLTARYLPEWSPLGGRDRAERIRLERLTCHGARYVFAMSDFLRRALIEDYDCDPDRVVTAGAGTNIPARSIQAKRYDGKRALFVGIDFHRKGGEVLLEAWPSVRERVSEAELWIVGPKDRHPGSDQPGIRWFGFVRDPHQMRELYARATAFVLPSLFEPLGLAFLEAMGQGLPCIGTARGGIVDTINDGANGLLVPSGDEQSLADAIVALLSDPDGAKAMGHLAHADVLREHTWDRVVERMLPYLERAVAGT